MDNDRYDIEAKTGLQGNLKPKAEGETSCMNTKTGPGMSRAVATATSLDLLASYLGNRLGRVVANKTGLNDPYDSTLEWAPDPASDSAAPSLTTALREQLGLRLESQKVPMQVLVIDRLDRPTEN